MREWQLPQVAEDTRGERVSWATFTGDYQPLVVHGATVAEAVENGRAYLARWYGLRGMVNPYLGVELDAEVVM